MTGTDRANALIVTSLGVSAALVLVEAASTSKVPAARLWVGLTFAGMGLSVMADVWPQIAGSLSLLILVTSVFVYGGPAWKAITSATTTAANTPAQMGEAGEPLK